MEPEPHYMRSTGRIAAIVARFISYLAYVYIIFVEVILFLGFFLLLFGANPSSSFVEWAYRNLDRAMKPFRGIFTPIELGTTNGNQIESDLRHIRAVRNDYLRHHRAANPLPDSVAHLQSPDDRAPGSQRGSRYRSRTHPS